MTILFKKIIHFEDDSLILNRIPADHAKEFEDLFPYRLSETKLAWMVQRFHQAFDAKQEVVLGIYAKEMQQYVGTIEIYHIEEDKAEIGYRMCISQRGKGIMKHALQLFLSHARELEIKELTARVKKDNAASIQILEQNGFVKTENNDDVIWYCRKEG